MTAANTDATNLAAVAKDGVVNESVMQKIWQIDNIPLPFTECCSKGTHGNQYRSFTIDTLGDPATDNAVIDGADATGNDVTLGARVGNYTQTSTKVIQISTRANDSDSIGRAGSVGYQVSQGQKKLRRDVEAQMQTSQASVAGDGTAAAGVSAGFGAWCTTNVSYGATGSAGGFNTTTGVIDAPTHGTAAAGSEGTVRDICQSIYLEGGNTTKLLSHPTAIRLFSEYLFTSSAKVATMTNQKMGEESNRSNAAYGSATVFISDFGSILELVPSRLMPLVSGTAGDDGVAQMFFIDPAHLQQSFLTGYNTYPLAKLGLSERRQIMCDYSLLVLNEASQGVYSDIDIETAWVV